MDEKTRNATMSSMSVSILRDLMESGLSPIEGMAVMANTLCIGFRVEGITREEAIHRLIAAVDSVYDNPHIKEQLNG